MIEKVRRMFEADVHADGFSDCGGANVSHSSKSTDGPDNVFNVSFLRGLTVYF